MKTLIVNNHSKHTLELQSIFPNSEIIEKKSFDQNFAKSFDLIIFSGGSNVPTVLNHSEFYQEEIRFISETEQAVLGICLGCEIVCETFGGKLNLLDEKESGEKKFKVIGQNNINILGEQVTCYESHSVGILEIPKDFEMIISSDHGPECIKHKTKPIIGIQFHPEVGGNEKLWEWIKLQCKC